MPKIAPEWCEEMAVLLEERAKTFLKGQPYDQGGHVNRLFERHRLKGYDAFVTRWRYAETLLDRITNQDLIDILVADLKSPDSRRRAQASRLVKKLSTAAHADLAQLLLQLRDPTIRKIVTHAMKSSLGRARGELSQALAQPTSTKRLARTLAVMSDLGDGEQLLASAREAFPRYSPDLKRQLLRTLARIGSAPAVSLVASALEDPNPLVRREALRCLKQSKSTATLGVFRKLLALQAPAGSPLLNIQMEALRTLARFPDPAARALLEHVCAHASASLGVRARQALALFDALSRKRGAARARQVVSTIV